MIQQKIINALALALLFFLLSLPFTYIQSDKVLSTFKIRTTFDTRQGLPTTQGLVIHTVVFFVCAVILLMTKDKEPSPSKQIELPDAVIKI